ncbi:MAG: hypothetical protein MJ009_03900 [Paludibacteraceae bacterium]|nr:hypothetical protein [Paludibacteraceae bacterium]
MSEEQMKHQMSVFDSMSRTKEAAFQRLYDCGILNSDGSIADEYKDVFVEVTKFPA